MITDKQIQEYITKQPYYGSCTSEWLEGIERGAKWAGEKAEREMKALKLLLSDCRKAIPAHTELGYRLTQMIGS